MNTVVVNQGEIRCDVAVFGAGPAGMAAAYTAAKSGRSTLLVEAGGKIGGVMSFCPGMMLGAGYPMGHSIGGFFEDFVERLYAMQPPRARKQACRIPEFGTEVIYDHEYAITLLYQLLEDSGAQLMLNTRLVSVNARKNRVEDVRVFGPAGMQSVKAKIWLDCTGDGTLADMAGVPSQVGDKEGRMMGGTLTFFMENVDWDKAFCSKELYFNSYAQKGIREGRLSPDIPEIYFLKAFHPGTVFFNTVTMSHLDGRDPLSVQRFSQEARWRCLQLAEFAVSDLPGFEKAHISGMGPTLGVRETRKLEGMHRLLIEEIAAATKFPDGIVACDNPIDDVFRGDEKNYSNERALEEGSYYTIPFRCLVPRQVENLMFAGRCISADDAAFASVRGMPQCMAMGQSIALAADMAIRENQTVQALDPVRVAERMAEQGVWGLGGSNP